MSTDGIIKEGVAMLMESHVKTKCWLQVMVTLTDPTNNSTDSETETYDAVVNCFRYVEEEQTFETTPLIQVALVGGPRRAAQLDLLPDYARRSRHQENLYPFAILALADNDVDAITTPALVVAVDHGPKMWAWANAIRWLGNPPNNIGPPPYLYAATTSSVDPHFTDANILQETLLKLDYFNETENRRDLNVTSVLWYALVGACVHVAERNVEILLSTERYDFTQPMDGRTFTAGNTPLSMVLEGNYSPSRVHIVQTLLARGHPIGRGVCGGGHYGLLYILTKPPSITGISSIRGKAVHEDDKVLVRYLLSLGESVAQNESFSDELLLYLDVISSQPKPDTNNSTPGDLDVEIEAVETSEDVEMMVVADESVAEDEEETGQKGRRKRFERKGGGSSPSISNIIIPEMCVPLMKDWLQELILPRNHLTTLPEILFTAAENLQVLDVSNNCLWELSPSVKKLTKLRSLFVNGNLLESLPEELATILDLNEVRCEWNPMLYPPRAVTDLGWSVIKPFFEGILKHGTVTNTDLKVLVVGLSEAGKTSLIQAIISGTSNLVRQGDRTVGIEQKQWSFERNISDPKQAKAHGLAGLVFNIQQHTVSFGTDLTCTISCTERGQYVDKCTLVDYTVDEEARSYTGMVAPPHHTYGSTSLTFPFRENVYGDADCKTPWVMCKITFTDDWNIAEFEFVGTRAPQVPVLTRRVTFITDYDKQDFVAEEDGVYDFAKMNKFSQPIWKLYVFFKRKKWEYRLQQSEKGDFFVGPHSVGLHANIADFLQSLTSIDPSVDNVERVTWQLHRTVPTLPNVNLLLYDFAGQQEYYITHHIFLTERALYVLAFDMSKYSSATFHDQILFWLTSIQERVPGAKVLLVGTHADKIHAADAQKYCEKINMTLRNKRSRSEKQLDKKVDAANIENAKYVKQRKRFAETIMSSSFHMSDIKMRNLIEKQERGIMLTDAEKELIAEYNTFYKSADALSPKKAANEAVIRKNLIRWDYEIKTLAPVPEVLAVSSAASMQGMDQLTERLKADVQDRVHFPELDEKIPAYYNKVRRLIRVMRNDPAHYYMSSRDYLELFSKELKLTTDEVDAATVFMHVVGEVLYYNKSRRKDGLDVIFLKVSFLVDAFKFIVRHDHADATIYREDPQLQLSVDDFNRMKSLLMNQGELQLPLLERMWACAPPNGIAIRKQTQPLKFWNLVELLSKFQIAAALKHNAEGEPCTFIVPEFAPNRLPQQGWSAHIQTQGMQQLERYFDFGQAPPSGIIQRLQVKLCPFVDPDHFVIAREGASVVMRGCHVFLQQLQGKNPDRPHAEGLQLIVRGSSENLWKTVNTMLQLLEEIFEEWPGLVCNQFIVDHANNDKFIAVELLKSERDTCVDLPQLETLLGPTEIEIWGLENVQSIGLEKIIATTQQQQQQQADEANQITRQLCDDTDDGDRYRKIVGLYREKLVPWAMLLYTEETHTLALKIFKALTHVGVAAWLSEYSGAHGTPSDRLRDGFLRATVVCPVFNTQLNHSNTDSNADNNTSTDDNTTTTTTTDNTDNNDDANSNTNNTTSNNTNNADDDSNNNNEVITTIMQDAIKAGVPIVGIDANKTVNNDHALVGVSVVVHVPNPSMITDDSYDDGDGDDDTAFDLAMVTLVNELTQPGRVKQLVTPLTGHELNRVRRKSFSEQTSPSPPQTQTQTTPTLTPPTTLTTSTTTTTTTTTSTISSAPTLHGEVSCGGTPQPNSVNVATKQRCLHEILESEIGFPPHLAQAYTHALELAFVEAFGNTSVENILLCDADLLQTTAITHRAHRSRIMMWIEQRKSLKVI